MCGIAGVGFTGKGDERNVPCIGMNKPKDDAFDWYDFLEKLQTPGKTA